MLRNSTLYLPLQFFGYRVVRTDCQKYLKNKNQLDTTYYFIVLLIGSTCFGHYYAHHQELANIMLIVSGLQAIACSPDTNPAYPHLTSNIQQTKNETTNMVIDIIIASF